MDETTQNREVMKSNFLRLRTTVSDQQRQVPAPPVEKPYPESEDIISLPDPGGIPLARPDIRECMAHRRSRRLFSQASLSLAELSFLLWATQGVQRVFAASTATYRTVPSGGARHPFETYLVVQRVEGLEAGRIYRYLAVSHRLLPLGRPDHASRALSAMALGQTFVGQAAVTFMWSSVPYRTEWRYPVTAHKLVLLDAGHLCQNLYLACEAIGAGTCAVAAYDQAAADALIGLDGADEFIVYMAPVGKLARRGDRSAE